MIQTRRSAQQVLICGRNGQHGADFLLEHLSKKRTIATVPRKIRQLIADLERAGFSRISGGKGSHRKFKHAGFEGFVLISGQEGDDAQRYQERQV